jgi:hypothetical protein
MVWLFAAIYLSFVFFIGFFVDVEPRIAEMIFATSFLWAATTITINNVVMKSTVQDVANEVKKTTSCKTCKKK